MDGGPRYFFKDEEPEVDYIGDSFMEDPKMCHGCGYITLYQGHSKGCPLVQ